MKPDDIYALTPIRTTTDLFPLLDAWHNHVPEIGEVDNIDYKKNNRIVLKFYYDQYIDGERSCTVGAAFFDDRPVMIFRHAGRGGTDEFDEIVTDSFLYQKMVMYLKTMVIDEKKPEVFDPEQDCNYLNLFYGSRFMVRDGKMVDYQ